MQADFIRIKLYAYSVDDEPREVFAERRSVGFDEIVKAEQLGYKAKYKFVLYNFEYRQEQVVTVGTEAYAVYRTYYAGSDKIEVYVESKLGV